MFVACTKPNYLLKASKGYSYPTDWLNYLIALQGSGWKSTSEFLAIVLLTPHAMVVSPTAYRLFQTSPIICASCVRHARIRGLRLQGSITQKRPITQNWLRKTAEAKEAWDRQAKEIEGGRKQSMLSILEERGYVNAVAGNRDNLDSLMTQKRIGAYLGIDPTAPSLHVGHLVPLMSLFWMYVNGFHTVTLVSNINIYCSLISSLNYCSWAAQLLELATLVGVRHRGSHKTRQSERLTWLACIIN